MHICCNINTDRNRQVKAVMQTLREEITTSGRFTPSTDFTERTFFLMKVNGCDAMEV